MYIHKLILIFLAHQCNSVSTFNNSLCRNNLFISYYVICFLIVSWQELQILIVLCSLLYF